MSVIDSRMTTPQESAGHDSTMYEPCSHPEENVRVNDRRILPSVGSLLEMGRYAKMHWDKELACKSGNVYISDSSNSVSAASGPVIKVAGSRDISGTISYWEVEITYLFDNTGPREKIEPLIEVGIVAIDHEYLSGLGESWAFGYGGTKSHRRHCHKFGFKVPTLMSIGVLYDGNLGTLSFYQNRCPVGTAFQNIPRDTELRPMVKMRGGMVAASLWESRRAELSLLGQCVETIKGNKLLSTDEAIEQLPRHLKRAIKRLDCGCEREKHRQIGNQSTGCRRLVGHFLLNHELRRLRNL